MKFLSFVLIVISLFSFSTVSAEENDKRNKITKNLRCLICQGQSIYDSQSDFAESMKIVVRKNLETGMSEKDIYQFMKKNYGEWVLYNPEINKGTYLLWGLPIILFVVGGAIIIRKLGVFKK